MTPAARIQAVIDLLSAALEAPRPADSIASEYFRARRYIGSGDRAAVSQRFYRVIRSYHRLFWHAQGVAEARRLVIAALLLDREHSPASLENVFSGALYAPAPLTAAEAALAQALQGKTLDDDAMPLRVKTECPEWAFEPLQNAMEGDFAAEMAAMQSAAPLDLRVNTLKAERDAVLARLKREGYAAEAGNISPFCVRLRDRPPITRHAVFTEGMVEIQDQGSQMVALLAGAKPGEQVADFCAGAGGKTLAMGAMMNNKGRIVALDVLGGRLEKSRERFRRAGLHNIETRALTGPGDKFVKRHKDHFDLVLVDAPCTGTGTWRRDPDRRWKQLGPPLPALVALQREILENARRMVKPGGRLVYATCSLLPEENALQVEAFLAENPAFSLRPAEEIIRAPGAERYMRLTPARHDTDGFFGAVMVRHA